jgi:hypothetical protein
MENNHDPRVDPQAGDTVTVGGETREVERVRDGRVYYSWPGKLAVRSLFPSGWQVWAAEATAWTTSDGAAHVTEASDT